MKINYICAIKNKKTMIKKNFFKVVAALLFAFMFSCDNTTDDPINNNKNNPATGGSGGNGSTGPTITGPRILHKILVNNEANQEFVTTGNVLQKTIFKETSGGANSFFLGLPTYTSGKISKVKFWQEINGAVPANGLGYEFDITYDSAGKINYTTCQTTLGGTPHFNMEYTYTYDGSGKMTKIVEKKKSGTTYVQFTNYNFTTIADNITKMSAETGATTPTGAPDMSVSVTTTNYNYPSYDNKINPYNTLPRTFFVVWSLVHPLNFSTLSANNYTSLSIETLSPVSPTPIPVSSYNLSYLYDSMNYPTSDQSQAQKYVYKAL